MDDFIETDGALVSRVQSIADRDGRYVAEAYLFVLDAVESTLAEIMERRHVSGQELCEGIRRLAVSRFGPMAKEVFNFWGIRSTADFGVIVFILVDAELLLKTEEDRVEDFLGVYDFDEAFERDYFRS